MLRNETTKEREREREIERGPRVWIARYADHIQHSLKDSFLHTHLDCRDWFILRTMRPRDSTLASSAIYIRELDPRVAENYDVNVEKSRFNFLVADTIRKKKNNNNNN